MIFSREVLLKEIIKNLTSLKCYVELSNAVNLYDINIVSEDFYAAFLNIIYDRDYVNLNSIEKNANGIDLVDEDARLSVQVTSDSSSSKIKHTIEEFIKNKRYETYDRLIILILTKKLDYTTTFDTKGTFVFDKASDIIDIFDLIEYIKNFNLNKLKQIYEFLEEEFAFHYYSKKNIEANEIDTIIDLIEYISSKKTTSLEPKDVIVDPNYKINIRFHSYAETIKNQYCGYLGIYGNALEEIETENTDEAMNFVVQTYLQDKSVEYLEETDNNPIKALNMLVDFFDSKLTEHGKNHDRAAIKFYLVDKIIKCCVFPNERSSSDAS